MAILRFVCPDGHERAIVGRPAEIAARTVSCKVCAKKMTRKVSVPGLSVVEELDNGLQGRRTVRYADAERAWHDHRRAHRPDGE